MKKEKTTVHVLTTLDDIVWLLNIRGNDVVCNPVVLSYALVTMERFYLFINEAVLDSEVKSYLKELGVTVRPYNDIYDAVSQLKGQKVLLETAKTNYAIISNLDESNAVVDRMNPTAPAKAGEPVSLLDVAEAAKAEAKKPKQPRRTAQKQKKPSIRAQLAAAKEEQKKKPPKREQSKELEV